MHGKRWEGNGNARERGGNAWECMGRRWECVGTRWERGGNGGETRWEGDGNAVGARGNEWEQGHVQGGHVHCRRSRHIRHAMKSGRLTSCCLRWVPLARGRAPSPQPPRNRHPCPASGCAHLLCGLPAPCATARWPPARWPPPGPAHPAVCAVPPGQTLQDERSGKKGPRAAAGVAAAAAAGAHRGDQLALLGCQLPPLLTLPVGLHHGGQDLGLGARQVGQRQVRAARAIAGLHGADRRCQMRPQAESPLPCRAQAPKLLRSAPVGLLSRASGWAVR